MTDYDDEEVPKWMQRYPAPDVTPEEFEEFIVDIYNSIKPKPEGFKVTLKEGIPGTDGVFVFDATVRFQVAGSHYLTVVEAKRHKNPIKRELVQALHSKAQSVGAHKAVMISTAKYQSGALHFAQIHGIALVSMTEGRFTFETKAATPNPPPTREEAAARFGLPTFVAHCYRAGDSPGTILMTLISLEHPEYVRDLLLPPPVGLSSHPD